MSEFVRVARTSDVLPGTRYWVEFDEETIVLFNVNGTFYAIADLCTHDGGPLEEGELDGYQVVCPRHGARFDIRSGAALRLPATSPVPTYQVRVEGDEIFVESPDDF